MRDLKSSPDKRFRVHLADGSKHDVLTSDANTAARQIEKLFPGIKVTKTKLIREQVSA